MRAQSKEDSEILRPLGRQYEKRPNQLSTEEMIWVQWYMLDRAPADAIACCSSLHAGPGQITFGSDRRQRADLTVVEKPGVVRVLNFHGGYYHYRGHEESCELSQSSYKKPEKELTNEDLLKARDNDYAKDEPTEEGDSFKDGLAKALTAVGRITVVYEVMTECQVFHGRSKVSSKELFKKHGSDYLAPPPFQNICGDSLVKLVLEGKVQGFITISGGETEKGDKVGRLFSFCQQLSCPREEDFSSFTKEQIRDLSGGDSEEELILIKRLASNPLNLVKSYFDSGGPGHTLWTEQFSWLVKKRGLAKFKVVHFVHYNARAWFKPFLEKNLQARWTLKSDPKKKLECQILKLLNNGFYGYNSIQSTNFSKCRVSSEKTLVKNRARYQKARQVLFLGCKDSKTGAFADLLKNGSSVSQLPAGFPDLMPRESSDLAEIRALEKAAKALNLLSGKIDSQERKCSLGPSQENDEEYFSEDAEALEDCVAPEESSPELLFLLTRKNEKGRLLNTHQISGSILGISKVIFYEHIRSLLELLDPRKAEICYLDTDSIIIATSEPELYECVEEGLEEAFEKQSQHLFVDESSPRHQTGKLKLEMLAKSGRFTSLYKHRIQTLFCFTS